MSEQNPYEELGVTERASFEEIQAAKNRLSREYRDDSQRLESLEAAYDAIIMDRLKRRQEGKIKVPEGIRFPERSSEVPAKTPPMAAKQPPAWLQRCLDTPSPADILWPAGAFLALSAIAALAPATEASLFPLLLVSGVFANLYFLGRKERQFGRALLMTLGSLLAGVGLGTVLAGLMGIPNSTVPLSGEQFACLVTFALFWLASSFLR